MRTHEPNSIMAISENTRSAADEDRVICVVRDLTDSTQNSPKSVTLPASYTVKDLVDQVAKEFGYETGSFKLLYERSSETELLDQMDMKLFQVVLNVGNKKKNTFQITDLDDGVSPVKVKAQPPGGVQFDEMGSAASNGLDYNLGPNLTYSANRYNSYGPVQQPPPFCGLVNQAMTCYLNSLLQTLFMTPEFRNALYSWEYSQSQSPDKCIPYQLQRLFLQMQTGTQRSVETTPVTRSFGWDSSHSWQQHDVQELCRVMFDALEINWKDTQQANLINELYQGKLKDYVKCLECKNESFRTDAYLDIPLVIKPFGAERGFPSVEAALKAFIEPEILDGANQYQCDKCDKKCDAHKGLKFETFPYLLTLQLKRFDFDYNTMNRIKLNDRMSFPQLLDLNGLIDDHTMPPTPGPKTDAPVFEPVFTDLPVDREDYSLEDFDEQTAQHLITTKGEYIYELFSIMIHSGSAVGGHYYAYIKNFADAQWYSFNDQSVTAITKVDIAKTYGGTGTRGIYSTTYTSSTNAYMLMYRKVDAVRNAGFMEADCFPAHLQQLIQAMEKEDEVTKQNREKERCMCRVRTYIHHPKQKKTISDTLEIDKDEPLENAVLKVYQMFELEGLVPLDRVRLVRFNCDLDSIERSFDSDDIKTIGDAIGGVKAVYAFELLLEIRKPDKAWQQFKLGGTTYKVHMVNVKENDVLPGEDVRAASDDKVSTFKDKIRSVLGLRKTDYMRCVLERKNTGELVEITKDDVTLREIGHGQGTKIYVDSALEETDDCRKPFQESRLFKLLDTYKYTISILLKVPTAAEVKRFLDKEALKSRSYGTDLEDKALEAEFDALSKRASTLDVGSSSDALPVASSSTFGSFENRLAAKPEDGKEVERDDSAKTSKVTFERQMPITGGSGDDLPPAYDEIDHTPCTQCPKKPEEFSSPPGDDDLPLGASAVETFADGELAAVDESKTRGADSNRDAEVWDYTNDPSTSAASAGVSSKVVALAGGSAPGGIEQEVEEEPEVFFKEMGREPFDSKTLELTIQMDRRMTLKRMKRILEKKLGISMNNFKMYKTYSNNQEIECTSNTESLNLLAEGTRMAVKLGRVLHKGEYKVKIFELELNAKKEESSQPLFDVILNGRMNIRDAKRYISDELKSEHNRDVSPQRLRLRKKTWKSPSQVYLDKQRIEVDISMYSNWEMFMQVLDGPEPVSSLDEMALFVQQWKPSLYEFGKMSEIVIPSSAELSHLKVKLSELSGISPENIEVAKGRGAFPGDVSVLEAHTTGLDWNPSATFLTSWPLYLDSGGVVIYRDKTEELCALTAEKRKEISVREAGNSYYKPTTTYSRKEKALKIYTNNDELGAPSAASSNRVTQADDEIDA